MKNINIALLGFGTVGSGVAETIKRNSDIIKERLGVHFIDKICSGSRGKQIY